MNYDQIKNNEERIFPFYKGQYMGKTELGFSNRNSAQRFMNDIPKADVYERLGGKEEYDRTHEYVHGVSRKDPLGYPDLYTFNPPKNNYYGRRQVDGIYNRDFNTKTYLKDMSENDRKEIKNVINSLGFISNCINDPKKLDIIRGFIEKWNLFPDIYIDRTDFDKMHRKMMKEDVEYKRGIVHISVEYLK